MGTLTRVHGDSPGFPPSSGRTGPPRPHRPPSLRPPRPPRRPRLRRDRPRPRPLLKQLQSGQWGRCDGPGSNPITAVIPDLPLLLTPPPRRNRGLALVLHVRRPESAGSGGRVHRPNLTTRSRRDGGGPGLRGRDRKRQQVGYERRAWAWPHRPPRAPSRAPRCPPGRSRPGT